MIERIEGMSTFKQKEYIQAENNAHDELVKAGYLPQGYDFKTKDVVVFKRINEHKSNEHTDVMHFKNWQHAKDFLIDKIIKTTDYFNITVEEAGKIINNYDTREEAKVLDAGLEHVFFETLEGLEKEYNSEKCKEYAKKYDYEILLFEFVADNSNHNKYCMVFK